MILRATMDEMSKTYTSFGYAFLCIVAGSTVAKAQITMDNTASPICAAILANDTSVGAHLGPGTTDSTGRARDTSARARRDTASFGIGGAKTGPADVMLLIGVHADQVRFGS